ncbi:MAG: hypothetical protein K9L89_07960 [Kiritimatiellales bacterium]|nr:hypothetical protein [Kiritimatiellales bacterium]
MAASPTEMSSAPVVSLSDIPEGTFRAVLVEMASELRDSVLAKVAELEIPENDFDSLRVHPNGALYYVCDFGGGMPLAHKDRQQRAESLAAAAVASASFTVSVPISSPPIFHSRPGATNKLFLDFNGGVVTNTYWNTDPDYGPTASWDCRPYGFDADETTFSVAEQQAIQTIWERVAEDYAPFDIDVTTEQPVPWNNHTGHVLITPETDKNGVHCPHFGYGGIAYVDVFGDVNYSHNYAGLCYSPAWVLNYETAGYAEYEAEAAAHEMGHNLALSHDGTRTAGYYPGHDNGSISWGPIMGTGYDRNVSQWSKGDYRSANNTEDDLAIIAARLAYRPDDFGDDLISADPLSVGTTGTVSQAGVVETTADADVFSFSASSGMVNIAVSPYRDPVSTTWGGNLDIILELYDGAGALLATNNPTLETKASLAVVVNSGTYYLKIRSTGVGDPFKKSLPNGYVQYGSLGQYTIIGSIVINSDADGDGIPNEWETTYFGGPTNAVAILDSDGDGQNNLAEYITGLDPTNASSVFKVVDFSAPTSNGVPVVVTWTSIAGRVYSVAWSEDLSNLAFSNLVDGLVHPQNSYTDTVERAGLQNFYRVEVQLGP